MIFDHQFYPAQPSSRRRKRRVYCNAERYFAAIASGSIGRVTAFAAACRHSSTLLPQDPRKYDCL